MAEAEEIDAFAAYCAETRRCYLLPICRFPQHRAILLRLSPTRNNQKLGINWAERFEFGATLARHQGAIAQLGERQRGTLEVAGSSPAGSIRRRVPSSAFH
jgi:PD-(D/E)XK endonuclease